MLQIPTLKTIINKISLIHFFTSKYLQNFAAVLIERIHLYHRGETYWPDNYHIIFTL